MRCWVYECLIPCAPRLAPSASRLGAGERRGERGAAAHVVALQVAHAAVRHLVGNRAAARLETLDEFVRQHHLAHEAALADHRVDHAVPAGELQALGGGAGQARLGAPVVGRLFARAAEGEQFVGADPGGVDDRRGERVAFGLARGDGLDLGGGVGARLEGLRRGRLDDRQRAPRRQLHGDVGHHGLDRLALHVERLLPHLPGPAFEVRDGAVPGQRGERHVEAGGDLHEALLVAAGGADRADACALQALDDAGGLLGRIARA